MALVVYKYEINPTPDGQVELELPVGYKFLCLGVQRSDLGDHIMAWFLVDPLATVKVGARFRLMPTGIPLPEGLHTYLGTVTVADRLVFHLFEFYEGRPT